MEIIIDRVEQKEIQEKLKEVKMRECSLVSGVNMRDIIIGLLKHKRILQCRSRKNVHSSAHCRGGAAVQCFRRMENKNEVLQNKK